MRILAVTNLFPNPYQPHRAPFNRHQLRLLSARHAVRVIAPILWTDIRAARRAGMGRLPVDRRVNLDGLVVEHPTYWYTPKVLRAQYGRFFLWSVRKAFNVAVAEFEPDLIFGSWAYPDGWAAVHLARRVGLPVIVKVHGSDIRMLEDFPKRNAGTAEALCSADGVIAVSRDLANQVIRLGADPLRVQVIGNCVDSTIFHPGDRAAARSRLMLGTDVRHLLSIGNLAPVKGQDVLLNACARLKDRIGPWELHLIGDGPMRDSLRRLATTLGIIDRVRFHGSLPQTTLAEWYRAADAFVLASRSEGVPNVLLEAAGCACPFVATRVGGVPEIAHLGACRLVPPERSDLLADGIIELLVDPGPVPKECPRDWKEGTAELAAFLEFVVSRNSAGGALRLTSTKWPEETPNAI